MVEKAKIAIENGWFEPEGHIYRDTLGNRVLSVTQIFQMLGLVDYSAIDTEVLEHKSEIGIAVHKSVELMLLEELDWKTVDLDALDYVLGTEDWLREMKFELLSTEQCGILEIYGMKIGYQYDQLGWMQYGLRRRPVVIDLKTASEKKDYWALQTAAYALAAPKLKGGEHYLRVVLHLQKDGRVKPLYYDDLQDEKTFLYMAYAAIWKQNHGYELAA